MFLEILRERLIRETGNYYSDNHDDIAFPKKLSAKKQLVNVGKRFLFTKAVMGNLLRNDYFYKKIFLGKMMKFDRYLNGLEFFYNKLEDEGSKELFIQLTAFKLLGYLKVRLPLSTPSYWMGLKEMRALENETDSLKIKSPPWKLFGYDLKKIGFPLKVYINAKGAYTTFVVQQYVKDVNGKRLGPAAGDIALDLGGCYGDTAVFFSYLVGEKGKVYSFEFIPGNIEVMKKNIANNETIKDRVEIVPFPLWDTSDKKIYFSDAGSASQVKFEKFDGSEGETKTITVDDFVQRYNIQKLDFIKTDIESAESFALNGAVNTLKRFKPKLAISIYHNMNDFTGLIKQIDNLNLGYKFYLGHYTIYASETILYASQ